MTTEQLECLEELTRENQIEIHPLQAKYIAALLADFDHEENMMSMLLRLNEMAINLHHYSKFCPEYLKEKIDNDIILTNKFFRLIHGMKALPFLIPTK